MGSQVQRVQEGPKVITIKVPSVRSVPYVFFGLPVMVLFFVFAMADRYEGNDQIIDLTCPFSLTAGAPIIEIIGMTKKTASVKNSTKLPTNECAPVWVTQLGNDAQQEFIKRFAPVAITEMEKYGVPASISLAQGLIESRAGTSRLAVQANNFFGIKCMSRRCHKGHCINATDDSHKDFFRKFESPWYSWREHSKLLSTGRYARLKKNGRDYHKWAYGLKSLGYATDPSYGKKLIQTIEQLDLAKYDRP